MSLHVKSADVPTRHVVRTGVEGEGAMVIKRGYGNECSLMWATRAPGYHTTPHAHEAEQIACGKAFLRLGQTRRR